MLYNLLDFSITKLFRTNLVLESWTGCQASKVTLRNKTKVQLLEFFMKWRLAFHDHEIIAIGFATESIGHNISLAWSVRNGEIKVFNLLNPSPLPEVQIWLSEDVFQTLMIGKDFSFVTQQVLSPFLEGKHNCCKFKIMCGIVLLMWVQLT